MIVIADSGSTKTDWCLGNTKTNSRTVRTGGINPFHQSVDEIKEVIASTLIPQLGDTTEFTTIYFYGAGCIPEKTNIVKTALAQNFPKANILVESDLALYFAFRIVRNFNGLRNRINVEKQLTEYKLVFFTNISHEFRTPLTLIQGALEKIQRVTDIPRELIYPLKTMDKSTQRMLRLINQLLEFRKMQNNKLALSLEETDVISFLYEIFLSFGDVAEQKNMNFRFLPSVPSYKMFIDKGNLDKVTYNLLSNAFKYTPSNGTIILSVNVDEGKQTLQIQVSDTGVGIPKEKQNELFKRFMQSNFSGDSIGVTVDRTGCRH